ncbi:MAG: PilZ domain-containing protein [Alphaproteobacteria bacterium]|nr:PilZ domain-containing protein [Alphaproteobacteria bacterium SS10]
MKLIIDGKDYAVVNWSLGGLCLEVDEIGRLQKGDRLSGSAVLPFQGFDISFELKMEVCRIDRNVGELGLSFVDLDDRATGLLSHYVDELVRGSMVVIEDTIQRIDVPVTPVSTKPDPNPIAEIPVRRWPIKMVAMTGFYAFLGLIVFGYALLLAYSNIFVLEIDSAVVSAPVETITAKVDGELIIKITDAPTQIYRGQVLAEIANPALDRRIAAAGLAVAAAEAEVASIDQNLRSAQRRARDHEIIGLNNVKRAEARLSAELEELRIAKAELARADILLEKGLTTASKRDQLASRVTEQAARVEQTRIDVTELRQVSVKASGDNFFESARLATETDRLNADRKIASAELRNARRRVDLLQQERDDYLIKAPFNGRLIDNLRANGASIHKRDALFIVEQSHEREILAFVRQEQILRIGLGDPASIYIPALDRTIIGRVEVVDRTDGFVQAERSRYSWRTETDRSGMVRLSLPQDGSADDVVAGLPAIVVFNQRAADGVVHSLATAWSSGLGHQQMVAEVPGAPQMLEGVQ